MKCVTICKIHRVYRVRFCKFIFGECFIRYELMVKLLGDSHQKQLANIRKTLERKKKEKERAKTQGAYLQDDEDDNLFKSVKKSQPDRYLACALYITVVTAGL